MLTEILCCGVCAEERTLDVLFGEDVTYEDDPNSQKGYKVIVLRHFAWIKDPFVQAYGATKDDAASNLEDAITNLVFKRDEKILSIIGGVIEIDASDEDGALHWVCESCVNDTRSEDMACWRPESDDIPF